jgi:hypothetical protein
MMNERSLAISISVSRRRRRECGRRCVRKQSRNIIYKDTEKVASLLPSPTQTMANTVLNRDA